MHPDRFRRTASRSERKHGRQAAEQCRVSSHCKHSNGNRHSYAISLKLPVLVTMRCWRPGSSVILPHNARGVGPASSQCGTRVSTAQIAVWGSSSVRRAVSESHLPSAQESVASGSIFTRDEIRYRPIRFGDARTATSRGPKEISVMDLRSPTRSSIGYGSSIFS